MQKINNMYTQLDPMKSMIQQLKKDKDSALKKVDKLKIEMSEAMKKLQVCICVLGPFKCYVTLFSWEFYPHPPPHNANNIEPYTFVMLFSGKADTPLPTALRNT